MKARIRRSGALLAGAAMTAGLVLAPTAALAQPVRAEGEGACDVTGGTFTWGVKESFRAYISGSIANGSWEESDGASYETPTFTWGGATGSVDPSTGEGSISFVGTVHFTGHEGVLDLTLANPTLEFDGDGTAALLLDVRGTDMEGEEAVEATQEWVGDVTAPDQLPISGDALSLAELPTTLTNSGAKAFAGFYEAGADLDPVSIDVQLAGCAGAADGAGAADPVDAADSAGDEAGNADDATTAPVLAGPDMTADRVPWLPIIIGGVAILVIGVTGGMLLAGRRRQRPQAPGASQDAAAESVGPGDPNAETTDRAGEER